MADPSTPGLIWQDVFTPRRPPLLTGIPAFLGYVESSSADDENRPRLVSSWPHYEQLFGIRTNGGYLAHCVRGFFENGGLICYVVPLNGEVHPPTALSSGLEALASLDSVDLVCAPDIRRATTDASPAELDVVAEMQIAILKHCQQLGTRFAILDTLNVTAVSSAPTADNNAPQVTVWDQRDRLLRRGGSACEYGAMYYPWLRVPDRAGNPRSIPPCGHVAGIYAFSDQRVGVHKPPANLPLAGVLDLRRHLSDAEFGLLNSMGVNGLRPFPGRGIRVWGARTLSDETDANWNYVNVRRLFVTVARWLEQFMANLAFETNDVRLWMRIMREVSAYCDDLFRRGALRGSAPAEAFFVKCDSETNPAEVVNAGIVVTEVGLAPVAPSEFIIVRIVHGDGGIRVEPLHRAVPV